MTGLKLSLFSFATLATVAMLTATELLLPGGAPLTLALSLGAAGTIYWFTGAAVYLNSSRHTTLSCLGLNIVALALLCALLLSVENGWGWTSVVSLYAAICLPPLLVRSYHVFHSQRRPMGRIERAIDVVSVLLAIIVTALVVNGMESPIDTVLVAVVLGIELAAAVWLLWSLWRAERNALTREQIALVLVGSVGQFLIFFVIFATSSFVTLDWVWLASSVVLPLTVCTSVLRRRFLDIELHRSFIYLLLTAVLTAAYVAILLAVAYLFVGPDHGRGATAIAAVLSVGFISIGFVPLVRLTHRLADYVVYRDNYDFRGVLRQMAGTIPSLADANELGDYVCSNLTAALNLQWCAVTSTVGASGHLLNSSGPVPVYDDLEIHETAFENVRRVPMELSGRHVGDIFVATRRSHVRLRPVDEDLLATVAYQTAVMLENYKLVDSLNERIRNLQSAQRSRRILHRRLAESEEATRAELSRNLHDGALQSILHLIRLSESNADARSAAPALENIANLGRDIAIELREICSDLRPHILDNLDLPAALESLVKRYRAQYGIELTLAIEEDSPGLAPTMDNNTIDKNVEVVVYRVINEALFNIFRHAQASTVAITLGYRADAISLVVRDDGVGFAIEEQDLVPLSEDSHLGVIGMFERVNDLDGTICISRGKESGTEVVASIPLRSGSILSVEF